MRVAGEYDAGVNRLKLALVAVFALCLVLPAQAQINGVPASVTSINFGGRFNPTPGVPASVTSLGPHGFTPHGQFFNEPVCCINPLFPVSSRPFSSRAHHRRDFFPVTAVPVYVPYQPVYLTQDSGEQDYPPEPPEEYRGGPTVFDRRGPGTQISSNSYPERTPVPEPQQPALQPQPETLVADQPQTVLVFKDGHQVEVQNYAVVGNTLFDLTPGRQRKIQMSELDLAATAKQNDERGIDFRLPPKGE
jgi:hypothetical protein